MVAIKIDEPRLILRKDGRLISPPLFACPGRNGANENKPATSRERAANFQFPAEIKPTLLDYVTSNKRGGRRRETGETLNMQKRAKHARSSSVIADAATKRRGVAQVESRYTY